METLCFRWRNKVFYRKKQNVSILETIVKQVDKQQVKSHFYLKKPLSFSDNV